MKHAFEALSAKFYHLRQFSKYCFTERGAMLAEARRLTKFGMRAVSLLDKSTRDDLRIEHLEPFVAHILGIFYTTVGHHDAIQTLALSGHSLESMMILRSHLEAVLAFLYVTEPQTNLDEVYARTDKYRHWVVVKMKQNLERSKNLNLLQPVLRPEFIDTVNANYATVVGENSPKELKQLDAAHSFLNSNLRKALAKRFGIPDLYEHIFAESSATIHFADIGDRMRETGLLSYRYTIRNSHGAFWPLTASNIVQAKCVQQFGNFFGVQNIVEAQIRSIFGPKTRLTNAS